MSNTSFTESVVEEAALAWLEASATQSFLVLILPLKPPKPSAIVGVRLFCHAGCTRLCNS